MITMKANQQMAPKRKDVFYFWAQTAVSNFKIHSRAKPGEQSVTFLNECTFFVQRLAYSIPNLFRGRSRTQKYIFVSWNRLMFFSTVRLQ